jgi:hypothetical protein
MSDARRDQRDVHVRIGRLVIDRPALRDNGHRGLRECVTAGISRRITAAHQNRASHGDLADAIADAVVERIAPQLDPRRRC